MLRVNNRKFIQVQAHIPLKMTTQMAEHMIKGAAK